MPIPLLLSPHSTSSDGSSSSSTATLSPITPVDDTTMHVSSSPPASSKTHAFFTSSYVASPPPRPPPALKKRNSGESISSTSSPKAADHPRSIFSPTSPSSGGFHISRIFPSRYTSTSRDADEAHDIEAAFSANRQRRKPQFLSLDSHPHDETFSDSIESALGYDYTSFSSYGPSRIPRDSMLGLSDGAHPAYGYERDRGTAEGDVPPSSASSSSTSSSSSHISIRLPTPPPPPPPLLTPSKDERVSSRSDHHHHDADSVAAATLNGSSDYTPRPASYEPSIASMLLRPFDPTPISKAPSMASTLSTAATEDSHDQLQETMEAGELHEGDIIAPAAAPSSPSPSSSGPSLRLLEPLGTGAFSAVWLAEDLSTIPLELASKKSVRDLKRHASLSSKGGLSRNSSVKSTPSSRNGSIKGAGGWNSVSRNSSLRKLKARLKGVKPLGIAKDLLDEFGVVGLGKASSDGRSSPSLHSKEGSAASLEAPAGSSSLSRNDSGKSKKRPSSSGSRLVAVKLTPRRPEPYTPQAEERTRVGFVREVEVLRHISHPNITPLLSSWTTPTHHVLVLPYLSGGDLLSLVNDDLSWNNLSEGVVRRIWCEICRGVGWMHSVGLVHRDVKLENVLLTWDGLKRLHIEDEDSNRFSSSLEVPPSEPQVHPRRSRVNVDDLPTPLIKLTDFGLSRFIDIGNGEKGQGELLTTRCGSEAYAAPELVMGSSSYAYSTPASPSTAGLTPTVPPPSAATAGGQNKHRSGYDARETDAWACGVVLYALVARKLPFGEGVGVDGVLGGGMASHIGGERAAVSRLRGQNLVAERRRWLMRIARGEWSWPDVVAPEDGERDDEEELVGPQLVRSTGARRVVEKLLVRDPRKRARIVDLWEDEWMRGDAIGGAMYEWMLATRDEGLDGEVEGVEDMKFGGRGEEGSGEGLGEGEWEPLGGDVEDGEEGVGADGDEDEEDDGWLLDEEGIGSIARQEVV